MIAVFAGGDMATGTPRGSVTLDCTTAAGADLPTGFAAEFCAILGEEIARNRPASASPAKIAVELARTGEFALAAQVTVHQNNGTVRSQVHSLSVRDSTLQPSIAKVLVFSVLKLLK